MKETIELAKELGFDCNTLYPVNISILTTVKNAVLRDIWDKGAGEQGASNLQMLPVLFSFTKPMTGLITLSSGTYIFRTDHAHGNTIWAWNIKDDYDKAMVHKWDKFPRHSYIETFNIDNPPQTVQYQPLLS